MELKIQNFIKRTCVALDVLAGEGLYHAVSPASDVLVGAGSVHGVGSVAAVRQDVLVENRG